MSHRFIALTSCCSALTLLLMSAAPNVTEATLMPCSNCNCSACVENCLNGTCVSGGFGAGCFCYTVLGGALIAQELIPQAVKAEDAKCAGKVLKLTGKLTTSLGKCAASEIKGAGDLQACVDKANAKYQDGMDKLESSGCDSDAKCSLEFHNTAAFAAHLVAESTQAPRICPASCDTVCDNDTSIVCTTNADCSGGGAGTCNILSCP